MFLCIGTTPAAQRVMVFRKLTTDAVNRAALTLDGHAGKAINVAKVLRHLGQPAAVAGFAGGTRGQALRCLLADRNIGDSLVEVQAPTRLCITVIDETTNSHTELVEESAAVDPDAFPRLLALIEQRLPQAKALVMSGSIVPGGMADLYRWCITRARERGILTVLDAQGTPLRLGLEVTPDVVKPNRTELAATLGSPVSTVDQVVQAARTLVAGQPTRVVVTHGAGPTVALESERAWTVEPPQVRVLNPIGSGDAFTAALAWRLAEGDGLEEACRWGAAAGAANALSFMPGELDRSNVEQLLLHVKVTALF